MIPETPQEIEDEKTHGNIIAALVRQHYETLRETGFEREEAFELAQAYHWNLIVEDD